MTNQQHPITPNPEQIYLWQNDWKLSSYEPGITETIYVATQAANWGADCELDACCGWLSTYGHTYEVGLRAARRPQPPSLKEQALEAMSRCDSEMWCEKMEYDLAIIRTALESLPS